MYELISDRVGMRLGQSLTLSSSMTSYDVVSLLVMYFGGGWDRGRWVDANSIGSAVEIAWLALV